MNTHTAEVATSSGLIPPNAENRYTAPYADLLLSHPMPGTSLRNSHHKVYLPIEGADTAKCPYRGTVYTLSPK